MIHWDDFRLITIFIARTVWALQLLWDILTRKSTLTKLYDLAWCILLSQA